MPDIYLSKLKLENLGPYSSMQQRHLTVAFPEFPLCNPLGRNMKYKKFEILNFKGIEKMTFDLSKGRGSDVYTLVGLNESGKTTILQALAFFYEKIMQSSANFDKYDNSLHSSGIDKLTDLIPKNREADFSENVIIKATIEMAQADADKLSELADRFKFKFKKTYSMEFNISLVIKFRDSKLQSTVPIVEFDLNPSGTIGRNQREVKLLDDPSRRRDVGQFIAKRLPAIIYYPNFLLEFPEKIQLEPSVNEEASQAFYRRFLQDILDSFKGDFELQKSIVEKSHSTDDQDRKSLRQTLRKMSAQEKIVFREDFKMLSNASKNKSIVISEPEKSKKSDLNHAGSAFNPLQLEIAIEDGINRFSVKERSLGFGWLFAFLLITHFRIQRKHSSKPIFIFDEPASNLHSTYQMALLKAIDDLVADSKALVIYSTHSHYMINPKWLGAAYIVQNHAASDQEDDPFSRPPTNIGIETYRSFAVHHPDQRTFFQPILDVLEYKPSNLEMIANALIVEGKSDYYFLEIFKRILKEKGFATIPGTGSGNFRSVTSLYIGWSKPMVIILDADEEGLAKKRAYLEEYGEILNGKIFTLADINPSWEGFEIEDLISSEDRKEIALITNFEGKELSKKSLMNAAEYILVSGTKFSPSSEARSNYVKIFQFVNEKLATQLSL